MAKESPKSTAPVTKAPVANTGSLEFNNEEQISFPPYWKPVIGASFVAKPMTRDDRQKDFTRYVLQAGQDIECQTGPTEDAEAVTVKKGEYFTMSHYEALPLDFYMGLPEPILITCKTARPATDKKKNDMFVWSIRTTDKSRVVLDARRAKGEDLPRGMMGTSNGTAELTE